MMDRDPAPREPETDRDAGGRVEPAPAVEVAGLSVRYGEVRALEDVSLTLAPGRVCGMVGMNGAGKSTLFKAIMGMLKPTAGTVRLEGTTPALARRRGHVAYVPQSEDVDWAFPVSVRDVVMMGRYGRLGLTRRPRPADHAAVDAALARVELSDLAGRQIGQLSGGQRKRAFVARGIAQGAGGERARVERPGVPGPGAGRTRIAGEGAGGAGILLLDEPFAGVDKRSEATIVRLLRELAAEGRTVLVSTHDLHALPDLADEAILLLHRVLFHGDVATALKPEMLARAFGFDQIAGEGADGDAAAEPAPGKTAAGDDVRGEGVG